MCRRRPADVWSSSPPSSVAADGIMLSVAAAAVYCATSKADSAGNASALMRDRKQRASVEISGDMLLLS